MIDFLKLGNASIFKGVPPKDIKQILEQVSTRQESFSESESIVREGDVLKYIGIVLSGLAVAVKNGISGEEVVMARLYENSVFADILSGSINFESPVSVIACTDCEILFISYNQLLHSSHPCIPIVLQNIIKTISLKYFTQGKRIEILMLKSVRQKVLTFLNAERAAANNSRFEIAYDRRLLADYLGVERSALSRELSCMKKDGLIEYKKNCFSLLY